MSYYGEARDYYGERPPAPYERPPYDRPPYDGAPPTERPHYERPPYERPPYEEHRSYESRPPYEESRSYDSRPPYSSPPSARPPSYPPPPLPIGWIQEWEPRARRAFYVETATGRSEWTLPDDVSYGEASRSGPGEYYAPPPPAPAYPPQEYGAPAYPPQDQGYGGEYQKEEKKHSDTGKILAAGAAGLAIGAVGGAILGHELTENSDEEHSHHSDDEPHYSDDGDD
ncbi:WW domain protein [Aspergillus foveolatus]|uniref:WW domain protein n=1 Tax=Aspergillus foveolatus TaxID=210207 RepID=UPI003CCD253D